MNDKTELPEEIKGWNWGAFLLSWIWGIGNGTYISFLIFVPVFNIFFIFFLGLKGNEWAWANRHWENVEHFKLVQKKWRNAGFTFFLSFPLLIYGILFLIKGELYYLSIKETTNNPKVIELVGDNLKPELIALGEINYSDSGAEGRLNYTIKGSKGKVRVYVHGIKVLDRWELKELWLVEEGKVQKLDLLENSKPNL